jgi:hypothetical protein
LILCSCSSLTRQESSSAVFFTKQFNKICLEGSGKGRIELVGSKYTFEYESQITRSKNIFDLALDFPIIGETKVSLSLSPKDVSKQIRHSDLVDLLREKVGDRSDNAQVVKTIEEFFVFASDFIRYKAANTYPSHFDSRLLNDHFLMSRETSSYLFAVDNFSENQTYFERTVFKIFLKSTSLSDPIMTLFLVPQVCESK